MTFRNLSGQQMFQALAQSQRPECAFRGKDKQAFAAWKKKTLTKVLATLGDWPKKVPLKPHKLAEWKHDGLLKQRWLIDVGLHIAATAQVNYPEGRVPRKKRPAILCWHGHGRFGKDPIMGNDADQDIRDEIAHTNSNYGHQMAQAGFVTFAIDWIGKGERDESRKPNHRKQESRDWCNLYYLHATMLGMTVLSVSLAHGKALTDFACTLPGIDKTRLGVMGLSGGGTMTVWSALTDARFKAAEVICYSDCWKYFGFRDLNYCGMQVAPGLFKLVDVPDLQGLIAPRPLLVDIGAYDDCFLVDGARECYGKVEKIYRAAGASDKLELDYFPGPHAWGGNRSVEFFGKWLG